MKRKSIITAISSIVILLCLLISCGNYSELPSNAQTDTSKDYSEKIDLLESQILLLMQTQALSKEEYQNKIMALENELKALKEESESTIPETNAKPDSESNTDNSNTEPPPLFTYIANGQCATITGYLGNDEILVIPTSIDGYTVVEIADSAIKSQTIKEVIISTSVTKIGWFAFSECNKLKAITIPSNVTKIGYSAFGNTNKGIVIYCDSGSFAQAYAESYGLSYTLL